MDFSKVIKIALINKGIKQVDIARLLGVEPPAVSMYIHDKEHSGRFDDWVRDNLNIDLSEYRTFERKNQKTSASEEHSKDLRAESPCKRSQGDPGSV